MTHESYTEGLCASEKIRKIKVRDVISSNNVRIHLQPPGESSRRHTNTKDGGHHIPLTAHLDQELTPVAQHVDLFVEGADLAADNGAACAQAVHRAHTRVAVALHRHVVRNVDHGVDLGLGEDALAACALDICSVYVSSSGRAEGRIGMRRSHQYEQ